MPSKRLKEKLTKENLWLYILSLLNEKEMYGYELRDAIEKKFGFKSGNVTAYRVLYSLKRKELVTSKEDNSTNRKRKYYQITSKGKQELEDGKKYMQELVNKL